MTEWGAALITDPATSAEPVRAEEREVTVEGRTVTLVGLPALDANTVVVTGSNQRRMILLMVPPGTPGGAARAVLRSAAGPDTVDSVEVIMASNGLRSARQGHRA